MGVDAWCVQGERGMEGSRIAAASLSFRRRMCEGRKNLYVKYGQVLIFLAAFICPFATGAQGFSNCVVNHSHHLYPHNLSVFGAYEGQQFTIGHVVMIVAKFSQRACKLPQPEQIGPECTPTMLLSVKWSGGTCYNITAAPSVRRLEEIYGFSFADDPDLQTVNTVYSHWVFPLHVLSGMASSRVQVKAVIIPPSCNSPLATFYNENRIHQTRHLSPRVLVDTQAPAIVSIHTGKSPGVYSVGSMITLSVDFSKDVVLSALPEPFSPVYLSSNGTRRIPYGVPYILLNSGAIAPLHGYDGMRSRSTVVFIYEVGMGEETPPGQQLDVVSIELNGGAIMAEGTGLDINMSSMPVPGGEGAPARSPSGSRGRPPARPRALTPRPCRPAGCQTGS
jgi:hypothetical protein